MAFVFSIHVEEGDVGVFSIHVEEGDVGVQVAHQTGILSSGRKPENLSQDRRQVVKSMHSTCNYLNLQIGVRCYASLHSFAAPKLMCGPLRIDSLS